MNRTFIIVLDSLGIGALPDADEYGDAGCNTLASLYGSPKLHIPTLQDLGLYNIDGMAGQSKQPCPEASFARLAQQGKGKDTTVGHWEIAGVISQQPLPTYPNGFPPHVLQALEAGWGRKILCNKPYSGTQVIDEFGAEHMRTGALIVYTSADSVLQIAAHEEIVPIGQLYEYCRIAREVMQGKDGVGRIIARPFVGKAGSFTRTTNRHDYALPPPAPTLLDILRGQGLDVISIGKIEDIFAGKGVSESFPTKGNPHGMQMITEIAKRDFTGLCFANLVDFDMVYGHRNDVDGYANALSEFDAWLSGFLPGLREGDMLMITADHGCDPAFPGTDHTREYTPLLVCGNELKKGVNMGTRGSFADIAATVLQAHNAPAQTAGESFLHALIKRS